MKKPYKSIYEIACKKLKADQASWMEDYLKRTNVLFAKALGIIGRKN